MKTITTMLIAATAMLAGVASAKPITTFRAPTTSFRAPAPVYRAPTPVYRAPAAAPRATTPVARTQARAPAPVRVTTSAATSDRQTVVTRRTLTTRDVSPGRPVATTRTTYRHGGRDYGWNSPSLMPVWWMAAMHRPYSAIAYDDFLRRCIQTPRDRRSRECVRALRERGYTY